MSEESNQSARVGSFDAAVEAAATLVFIENPDGCGGYLVPARYAQSIRAALLAGPVKLQPVRAARVMRLIAQTYKGNPAWLRRKK